MSSFKESMGYSTINYFKDWHPYRDYRTLSVMILPDRYPIPCLHDFAQIETQAILHKNQSGRMKKDKSVLNWTEEMEEAFKKYKNGLVNAVMLAHPSPSAKLVVRTDASDSDISVVVEQIVVGNSQLRAFCL